MANSTNLGRTMWNVLTWASNGANAEPAVEEDTGADTDEPPEGRLNPLNDLGATTKSFEKTTVRQTTRDHHESLLTKALHCHSEDENFDSRPSTSFSARRRSMTSNISFASTEFTNDTGVTTPARTSSPSPRLPNVGFVPIAKPITDRSGLYPRLGQSISPQTASILAGAGDQAKRSESFSDSTTVASRRRCISFACAAKPVKDATAAMPPPPKPSEAVQPTRPSAEVKRPCIKFTCPTQDRVPLATKAEVKEKSQPAQGQISTPSSVRKIRSSSSQSRGPRSLTPRRPSHGPSGDRGKKFFTAKPQDLNAESSRFHAFASNEPQEDDWIRQDKNAIRRKLTIDDTLKKELAIRRLGKEAEEEAEEEDNENDNAVPGVDDEGDELEDDDDEADLDDEEEEEEDENEDEDEDDEDDDLDDDASFDGYSTDNEVGFASSDDDDDDGLLLWTTREPGQAAYSGASPAYPQPSFSARSDSSIGSTRAVGQGRRKAIRFRPGTPELPDSTDFVCGTLDEDRPLEEAYLSCIAARQREKLHVIPQDIDPSFPTSDPEDDEDEVASYKAPRRESFENMWQLEDLGDEQDRPDRRRKNGESPKRYHSPAPRRCHSPPPPKPRGRSPRRLFDRHSPARRMRSPPPPQTLISPPASPVLSGKGLAFKKSLAFGPAQTTTKSLPRAAGFLPHHGKVHRRSRANTVTKYDQHVRGAIDIVKGLEEKRKRRKEKFQRKHCDRARKGQIHEKRPAPGQGAERMKELVTGKAPQNYVLSC